VSIDWSPRSNDEIERSDGGRGVGWADLQMRRVGPVITPRDVEILRWIGRHGIVTQEQIARRFFDRGSGVVGVWASYRRLRKLAALGLVRRDPTHWKAPQVLRLTGPGARFADLGLHPAKLVHAEIRHSLELVDLVERVLVANPAARLTTERELRAERHRQRRAGQTASLGRIPDGVLTWPSGATVAIELDLTSKRERDIVEIIAGYATGSWTRVWWFVPAPRVARLQRVVEAQRADDLVQVWPWPIP
jgi:Replication-relaxation